MLVVVMGVVLKVMMVMICQLAWVTCLVLA